MERDEQDDDLELALSTGLVPIAQLALGNPIGSRISEHLTLERGAATASLHRAFRRLPLWIRRMPVAYVVAVLSAEYKSAKGKNRRSGYDLVSYQHHR